MVKNRVVVKILMVNFVSRTEINICPLIIILKLIIFNFNF